MQKITNNVYAETEFRGCTPGFVVTKEGVVMIDTPQMPQDAIKWRDDIAKYGPVRYLINTEPHADHFTGNYFFEGTIVAHEGTRAAILASSVEQMKERLKQTSPESLALVKDFSYRPPTITLSERLTLYVGNHTFQLISLPGHTPYEVAVYIPEEKVAFTTDNIFCRVKTWLQQAVPYEWLDSLKRIEELGAEVLIPGHGSICDCSYIPEQCAIVQAWIDGVTACIRQGLSPKEAEEKLAKVDPYSAETGGEQQTRMIQSISVAHLYEVLKK